MPDNIVSITESDFQLQVIDYSKKLPVLLEFWADWSTASLSLAKSLHTLATEAKGAFRLARANVDQNQRLVMQFDVKQLPFVLAFHHGQMIEHFNSLLSEQEIRQFLRRVIAPKGDLSLEKGNSLLNLARFSEAEGVFRQKLVSDPDHPAALLGLAKSYLCQDKASHALVILTAFPSSKEYQIAEILTPLARWMAEVKQSPYKGKEELRYIFEQALRLVGLGNLEGAADGLLDLLRQQRQYLDKQAQKVLLAVFELMPQSSDKTRAYRSELANILF